MNEEATIRKIALAALREQPSISVSQIYAELTKGMAEDNAAQHQRRRRIAEVLKRSLSLTAVYFDGKVEYGLIWARSEDIPILPQVRPNPPVGRPSRTPPSGRAEVDLRLRHLHIGVLLLTAAATRNLELSGGPQPYRRVIYLMVEDESAEAAREYTAWYDAEQHIFYGLVQFYRREGVGIDSRLQLTRLEQPASYRVRINKRERDAAYAADYESLQAAKLGRDYTPPQAPNDEVISLTHAIKLRLDDTERRMGNLQRLLDQFSPSRSNDERTTSAIAD